MSWPKSVLLVGAILIFAVDPILGSEVAVKLAIGIIVLWMLIGPGFGYARAFAESFK